MKILNFFLVLLFFNALRLSEELMDAGNVHNEADDEIHKNSTKTSIVTENISDIKEIYAEYFRHHGVHCVTIVVCNELKGVDATTEFKSLVVYLMANGFYVNIFNGNECFSNTAMETLESKLNVTANADSRRPLRFNLSPSAHKSGVLFLTFQSSCALNALRWSAISSLNYFSTNRFWLLLAQGPEDLALLEDDGIFIPPDGEVRILWQSNNSNTFNISDVYKVEALGRLKTLRIGENLRSAHSMIKALDRFGSAISHRTNLEGTTFSTGLVIAFPDVFTNIEDLSIRHIDTISKVNHRLTKELANALNMRFNTHQMDNYGWRQPNGSFDGLMGMFERSELDFAQLAIFMRLDRMALVDFIAETFRIRAGLIFRQPSLSAVANIFALPFTRDVWISIFVLIIFTVMVFSLELKFSPHRRQGELDFWDCCIFVWGAMCQQGFYVNVINRSGRIIVFTTFVATLFLFTSFSANIVALLQSPSEAITSLNDLSQSPLEVGVQDTQYNKIYFTESTDPVTNRLYHKKIAPKGDGVFMRPPMGIKKMRTGLFAYQVELQAGYQIISDTFSEPEKCGLKELEPFQLPMIAIPTRKNFPYKELFRRQLRWQREVGLMNREELKWIPQKPKCEGGVGGFVSIGLTECRYALAMFGCGMLLGLGVFIFEAAFEYFVGCLRKFGKGSKILVE